MIAPEGFMSTKKISGGRVDKDIIKETDDEFMKGFKSCGRLESTYYMRHHQIHDVIRECMESLGYQVKKGYTNIRCHVTYTPKIKDYPVFGVYYPDKNMIFIKHPSAEYSFNQFAETLVHELVHALDTDLYHPEHVVYEFRPREIRAKKVATMLYKKVAKIMRDHYNQWYHTPLYFRGEWDEQTKSYKALKHDRNTE